MSEARHIRLVSGEVFPHSFMAARAFVNSNGKDFAGRPYYLIRQSDLIAGQGLHAVRVPNNTAAFTSGNLSEKLEQYLRNRGAWIGCGFAVVFNAEHFAAQHGSKNMMRQAAIGLALLIHEAGHEVNCQSLLIEVKLRAELKATSQPVSKPEAIQSHPRQARAIDSRCFIDDAHGPRFVRATLHLWHRLNQGCGVGIEDLSIAGSWYGMSDVGCYRLALGDEPQRKMDVPVWQILMSQAPKMFDELWQCDLMSKRMVG